MAINIDFINNIPQEPTLVLMSRSGDKIGIIQASDINIKSYLNSADEISFNVKKDINNSINVWENITDFKLVWCREWNALFEIHVELEEGEGFTKFVTGESLGEIELGQIVLYNIEINTEDDIARDDYEITVLYDPDNPEGSLLNRITEKAPHYTINHVDTHIASIQRTFSFDNTSIYDAFQEIAEEINCIFIIKCYIDSENAIAREINVYDLESYCLDCGERGNFTDVCPKCSSTNINHGYGDDTSILVSTENLTNNIRYTTDTDSVKNCFRLEGGDDLMTAAIIQANPNGSQYIWYISDEEKRDMSDELSGKINEYDDDYEYYYNTHQTLFNDGDLEPYNLLVEKYSEYTSDYREIPNPVDGGYSNLNGYYFDTIDFHYYLNDSFMPNASLPETTAEDEVEKLTSSSLSHVAVVDLSVASKATVDSAVTGMANVVIDGRYDADIQSSTYEAPVWTGTFVVTNKADDSDTATSQASVTITITDDYEDYVKNKIDKALKRKVTEDATDIVALFNLDLNAFKNELKKYCLSMLLNFKEACQSCIDIMIEQGTANKETWGTAPNSPYDNLYVPYRNKMASIDREIKTRSEELEAVDACQSLIEGKLQEIKNILNFKDYLGEQLWLEFASHRREDTYSNDNYVSDGLTNAELMLKAKEFIDTAQGELYKSATLQHSISATLANLLVIKDFAPIVDYFEVGNWIRIRVEDNIYRLRLIDYEISYSSLEELSVTFSDVTKTRDGVTDIASVLSQAKNMATSYGAVTRQSKSGVDSQAMIRDWFNNGLQLTSLKIIDSSDNQNITWDEHGLLAREYNTINNSYDPTQLKIINKGLYVTEDDWETASAGIGEFTFYNPKSGETETRYGVIAKTLVGSMILSEEVNIFTEDGSTVIDENGIVITSDQTISPDSRQSLTIQRKRTDPETGQTVVDKIFYVDSNGNLRLNSSPEIDDARRVATNYIAVDDEGKLMIADMENGAETPDTATSRNVLIDNNRVDIRNGTDVLASFGTDDDDNMRIYVGAASDRNVYIDNEGVFIRNGNSPIASFSDNIIIGEEENTRMNISSDGIRGINNKNMNFFDVSLDGALAEVYSVVDTSKETLTPLVFETYQTTVTFPEDFLSNTIVGGLVRAEQTFTKDIWKEFPDWETRYVNEKYASETEFWATSADRLNNEIEFGGNIYLGDDEGTAKATVGVIYNSEDRTVTITLTMSRELRFDEVSQNVISIKVDLYANRAVKAPSFSLGTDTSVIEHAFSCTIGENLKTNRSHQLVIGRNNTQDNQALFIIANGTTNGYLGQNNKFVVYGEGNVFMGGALSVGAYESGAYSPFNAIESYGRILIAEPNLYIADREYDTSGGGALCLNNGDIVGLNGVYFNDKATSYSEGINWKNDDNQSPQLWDSIWANSGKFYFAPESGAAREILHAGNYTTFAVPYIRDARDINFGGTEVPLYGFITNDSKEIRCFIPWAKACAGTYTMKELSITIRCIDSGVAYPFARSGSSGGTYTQLGSGSVQIWSNGRTARTNEVSSVDVQPIDGSGLRIIISFVYPLTKASGATTQIQNNVPIAISKRSMTVTRA